MSNVNPGPTGLWCKEKRRPGSSGGRRLRWTLKKMHFQGGFPYRLILTIKDPSYVHDVGPLLAMSGRPGVPASGSAFRCSADIQSVDVRSTLNSRQFSDGRQRPLVTLSGHWSANANSRKFTKIQFIRRQVSRELNLMLLKVTAVQIGYCRRGFEGCLGNIGLCWKAEFRSI